MCLCTCVHRNEKNTMLEKIEINVLERNNEIRNAMHSERKVTHKRKMLVRKDGKKRSFCVVAALCTKMVYDYNQCFITLTFASILLVSTFPTDRKQHYSSSNTYTPTHRYLSHSFTKKKKIVFLLLFCER